MIFQNFDEISKSDIRRDALKIIEAGISSVLPDRLLRNVIDFDSDNNIISINDFNFKLSSGRLFVIGAGKAAGRMAKVLEDIITPERITAGIVNCNSSSYSTKKITVNKAGHPIPDRAGVAGVKEMLSLKSKYSINEADLILCLISGGGSALLPNPVTEVSLEDIQKTTELLLASGADITEINTVRKHLSQVKGGRLGEFFTPAAVVSLIISDIIGNPLDAIASGPTSPDSSMFKDAYERLNKLHLLDGVPVKVRKYLENNIGNQTKETPKILDNCKNYIIGDNQIALTAMEDMAKETGYKPLIITKELRGEPGIIAREIAEEILQEKYSEFDVLLLGGETTPILPENHGKGGRNQHYIIETLQALANYPGEYVVASVSSDGSDYLPNIAGAIIDNDTLNQVRKRGLSIQSSIEKFDSFNLLNALGKSLVRTGYTNTNVGDLVVYILK